MLFVRRQQVISSSHPLPVVFVGSSAKDAYLIVLAAAIEPWPSKPMGAKFTEESLQESHVCRFLPARLGGVIRCEEWRVNRFDYRAVTFSNYESAYTC